MLILISALLLAAGQGTAPAASAPAPPEKPKLICRREVPIGSLIASRKMCLTKDEWAQREKDGNDTARKMVYDGTGKCFDPGLCPH